MTIAFKSIREDKELQALIKEQRLLLGAYANKLTPVDPNWTMETSDGPQPFRDDLSPQDYFDRFVKSWVDDFGVQMVGGCCGFTPAHISYLQSHLTPKN